jgi:uncharacterized protein YjhX (UPF0386 family)
MTAKKISHLNCEERDAGALVPEGEVDALFGDGDGLDLGVDDDRFVIAVAVEAALAGGDAADHLVAFGLPRRWLASGRVEFVKEQAERLLARECIAREERAVADGEFHLDVQSVGRAALNERRPQPVVDIVEGHVAHHVRAPVDALFEICVALLHPLKHKKTYISINRFCNSMQICKIFDEK